jgi:outer membrane protease
LNRIEISLKEIIKKDVSMIIGGVKLIDEKNRLIKFGNVDNSIQNINYVLSSGKIHVTSPTMFYSTELIKKYGDLSININNEDEILAFRALNEKGIFVLEEYLVSYRKHTGSITFKQTKGSFKKYINWLLDNDLQNQVNNKTDWLSVSRFRGQNIDIENKIDLLIRKILIQRENLKYLRELNNFSFWWCAFFKLKYRIHLQDYLIEMVRPIYYKTRVYLNKVLHRGLE